MLKATKWLIVFIIVSSMLAIQPQSSINAEALKESSQLKKALVVYNDGVFPKRYANTLSVYLGHFNVKKKLKKQKKYIKGEIEKYDVIFYIGGKSAKPSNIFLEDIKRTDKEVVWIHRNIKYLGDFVKKKYGFTVNGLRKVRYISYNGVEIESNVNKIANISVINKKKIKIVSTAKQNIKEFPYVISSKNFTYFAGNPFFRPTDEGPNQIFADYLHEVIEDHKPFKKGLVRIEDVHPNIKLKNLELLIDYLYINEVPFSIGVIPVYQKSSKSKPIFAHDRPEFVKLLKYARKKGANFVLHGYDHRFRGESAIDAEFWDEKNKKPVKSRKYTENKIRLALREMKRIGIEPLIWETPHYKAGVFDRKIISKYFKNTFERQGLDGDIPVPFFIERNKFGQKVIPETLTYPTSEAQKKDIITTDYLVSKAKLLQLHVRDSYGSFFIHSFIPVGTLHEIVSGMQREGFKFVSANELIGEKVYKPKKANIIDTLTFNYVALTYQYGSWAVVSAMLLSYYLVIFGLSSFSRLRKVELEENPDMFVVFVLPALNEEKVIERTVRKLISLKDKNFMVLAINDNSDDDTLNILHSVKSKKLKVISTKPPFARIGKGNVLNYAYHFISNHSIAKKYNRENILICVVDSDGHVDSNIIRTVTPYFADKKTGAVQVSVRITNSNVNLLTRWQDYEFSVFNYIFQSARDLIGSVGLGGNGQFVRLSAADSMGEEPWSECLTEDLEIGLRLMLQGWRNRYCSSTYVAQQAVQTFRPLIVQRTRWIQGHLTCWKYLPSLAASNLPLRTRLDTAYYLLAIVFIYFIIPTNVILIGISTYIVVNPYTLSLALATFGSKTFIVASLLSYGVIPIFIYSYWKTREQSLASAIILTFLYMFVSVIWLISGYKALIGLSQKRKGWDKTPRWSDVLKDAN